MLKNYYQILDVSPQATKDEIKKAYKLYVFKFHPDKHDNDPFFNARFLEVQEAYDVLSDDNKRRSYDYDFFQDNDINDDNNFVEDPFINISVNKRSIKFGDTVKFIWETQNISELIIVGHGSYPSNGSVTFTPTKNTNYVFLFSNKENTYKKETTITVEKNKNSLYFLLFSIPVFVFIIFKIANQTPNYETPRNQKYDSITYPQVNNNTYNSENRTPAQSGIVDNWDYPQIIKSFFYTEELRDFDKISEFFSPNVSKYFDLNYPTISQLKDNYNKAWEKASKSKNEIHSINKVENRVYQVNTTFSFLNSKTNTWKKFNVINEFKFDENGKIISISQISSSVYVPESSSDIAYIIKTFISQNSDGIAAWNIFNNNNSLSRRDNNIVVGEILPFQFRFNSILTMNGEPIFENEVGDGGQWGIALHGARVGASILDIQTFLIYQHPDEVITYLKDKLSMDLLGNNPSEYVSLYSVNDSFLKCYYSFGANSGSINIYVSKNLEDLQNL